jgi:hypothetical protein
MFNFEALSALLCEGCSYSISFVDEEGRVEAATEG